MSRRHRGAPRGWQRTGRRHRAGCADAQKQRQGDSDGELPHTRRERVRALAEGHGTMDGTVSAVRATGGRDVPRLGLAGARGHRRRRRGPGNRRRALSETDVAPSQVRRASGEGSVGAEDAATAQVELPRGWIGRTDRPDEDGGGGEEGAGGAGGGRAGAGAIGDDEPGRHAGGPVPAERAGVPAGETQTAHHPRGRDGQAEELLQRHSASPLTLISVVELFSR